MGDSNSFSKDKSGYRRIKDQNPRVEDEKEKKKSKSTYCQVGLDVQRAATEIIETHTVERTLSAHERS